eukprot:4716101-Amphidinium_carterae.1
MSDEIEKRRREYEENTFNNLMKYGSPNRQSKAKSQQCETKTELRQNKGISREFAVARPTNSHQG